VAWQGQARLGVARLGSAGQGTAGKPTKRYQGSQPGVGI